jgi:hypothetical protein
VVVLGRVVKEGLEQHAAAAADADDAGGDVSQGGLLLGLQQPVQGSRECEAGQDQGMTGKEDGCWMG